MYQTEKWAATDDAEWAVAIEIIDDITNLPMDVSTADFALQVSDCGSPMLIASTAAATITKPTTSSIQWIFTASQMAALCPGKTYEVGLIMYPGTGGTKQLIVGSLAIVNGGF